MGRTNVALSLTFQLPCVIRGSNDDSACAEEVHARSELLLVADKMSAFDKSVFTDYVSMSTSKTRVRLDDPHKNVSINVHRFNIQNDRVHFSVTGQGKVAFDVQGKTPKLSAKVGGSARTEMTLEGTVRIDGNRLHDTSIGKLEARLSDVRFKSDVLEIIKDLIKDCLNTYVRANESTLKAKVAEALNGTRVQF